MAQQQQQAAIAAANPPAPTESVVTKPSSFDSSLTSYHDWRRSLSLYMAFNALKFPDDATKVACMLACMTLGSVTNWAQAYVEGHLNATGNFCGRDMGRFHPGLGCKVQGPQPATEGHGIPP